MMSFKESLDKLVKRYGVNILTDKFKTQSFLSDYVGSNYQEKKLLDCFINVCYNHNLIELFKKKGISKTRKYLENIYKYYVNDYTKKEYINSINPLSKIICPLSYKFIFIKNNIIKKIKQLNNSHLNQTNKYK